MPYAALRPELDDTLLELQAHSYSLERGGIDLNEWYRRVILTLNARYPNDPAIRMRLDGVLAEQARALRTSTSTGTRPLAAA